MHLQVTTYRSARRSRPPGRAAVAAVVAVLAAVALVACEPPPPPDGRDLGLSAAIPADLAPGETRTFPVVVTNHGTAPTGWTSVGLVAPANLRPSASTAGEACTGAPLTPALDLVACAVGPLAAGQSATVSVTLSAVAAASPAPIGLVALSDGTESATDPHPNRLLRPVAVGTAGEVDLHVVPSRTPVESTYGQPFDSIATVANRGRSAASQVTVTQSFDDDAVALTGATFARADGGATGTCTIEPGLATCTTGTALVEPLDTVDDRWVMRAVLVPDTGSAFFLEQVVTSPHPEPTPDPWPNAEWVTHVASCCLVSVGQGGPVPVGTEFDVDAGYASPQGYVQYVGAVVPAGFALVSVTAGGRVLRCSGTDSVFCATPTDVRVGGATFRFRAVSPTDPVTATLSFSSEAGGGSGDVTLHAFDPAVSSEIHPDVLEPTSGVVGDPVVTTGVVRNPGTTDHEDVTLQVAVTGAADVQVQWGEALLPCLGTGTSATCYLGTVPAHTVVPIRLATTATAPGDVTLDVTVTSATPQQEPDPTADHQRFAFPVLPVSVDLGVEVASEPGAPTLDMPYVLLVTTTNHGPSPATGARLTVTIPASLSITAATISDPAAGSGDCTVAGQEVTCVLGTLAVGSSPTVVVYTSAVTATGGALTATATSDRPEREPDPTPNTVVRELTIGPPSADLTVEINGPTQAVVGRSSEYLAWVFDLGPSDVDDAIAVVRFPDGWVITAATVWGRPCAVAGATVTCTLPPLSFPGGAMSPMVFDAHATAPVDAGQIRATASSSLPDPDPASNEAVHEVQVAPAAAGPA